MATGVLITVSPGVSTAAASISSTTSTASTASTTSTTSTTATPGPTSTTAPAPAANTPTDSWLQRATAAESGLGSVHINGLIKQGKSTIVLALVVNGDGEGGGSFTQQGSRIQIKRVGPVLYFNAPKKYWSEHASTAQTTKYGGKWIEVSALDSRWQSFDQFLNAGELTAAIFQGYEHPLTVSKPTTLDGHKVVIVSDSASAKGKKSSAMMYIAATGKPYVLKIVDDGTVQSTTLNFASYGHAVSISTPPEPINLS